MKNLLVFLGLVTVSEVSSSNAKPQVWRPDMNKATVTKEKQTDSLVLDRLGQAKLATPNAEGLREKVEGMNVGELFEQEPEEDQDERDHSRVEHMSREEDAEEGRFVFEDKKRSAENGFFEELKANMKERTAIMEKAKQQEMREVKMNPRQEAGDGRAGDDQVAGASSHGYETSEKAGEPVAFVPTHEKDSTSSREGETHQCVVSMDGSPKHSSCENRVDMKLDIRPPAIELEIKTKDMAKSIIEARHQMAQRASTAVKDMIIKLPEIMARVPKYMIELYDIEDNDPEYAIMTKHIQDLDTIRLVTTGATVDFDLNDATMLSDLSVAKKACDHILDRLEYNIFLARSADDNFKKLESHEDKMHAIDEMRKDGDILADAYCSFKALKKALEKLEAEGVKDLRMHDLDIQAADELTRFRSAIEFTFSQVNRYIEGNKSCEKGSLPAA